MTCLLVPLDGSELGNRALPLAAELARTWGDDLRLLEAIQPNAADMLQAASLLEESTAELLSVTAAELREQYGMRVTTLSRMTIAPQLILEAAKEADVRAVIMSTHGRSGLRRALMGSVAEHVLRESTKPVILVPASAAIKADWKPRRILVPLDGSALSESVLSPIEELARKFGSELILMRAYPEPPATLPEMHAPHPYIEQLVQRVESDGEEYIHPIVKRLMDEGIQARAQVVLGEPAAAIVEAERHLETDLVAMATHGRSGLNRLRNGSVTESVLRHSNIPVMAFGQSALSTLQESSVAAVAR